MSVAVDIVLEHDGWAPVPLEALATRAATATLERLRLPPADWEIVVLGCDDVRIAGLNGVFRGKAAPTNVLSWPSEERGAARAGAAPLPPDPARPELGDIALSLETCRREASAAGRPLEAHLTHLLVHGVLHLLGYDHGTEADAALMERLETEILAGLGIPDPYAEAHRTGDARPA